MLACCSSPQWARQVAAGRPYADVAAVLAAADAALAALSDADLDDALAGHPRIGERVDHNGGEWSRQEQSGMDSASRTTAEEMAAGNREYEARFGHVYLVSAAGRSAQEMLDFLRERLGNDPATERGDRPHRAGQDQPQPAEPAARRRRPRSRSRSNEQPDHARAGRRSRPPGGRRTPSGSSPPTAPSWSAGGPTTTAGSRGWSPSRWSPGDYRLVFDTGGYHRATGQTGFYPEVAITFRVTDPQQHHHVPLLLAPFAYSTYRGS